MIKGYEIMEYLRPDGGYYMVGHEYEGIEFIDCEPVTKEEFEATKAAFPKIKADMEKAKAEAKQTLLDKLGITADEAKLLLN